MSRAGVLALRRESAIHRGRFEQALRRGHGMPDARLDLYVVFRTVTEAEIDTTTVKKGA